MKQIFLTLLLSTFFIVTNAQHNENEKEKPIPILDHIAFYVKNLDTSVTFYSNLFQLDTLAQPFKGARVKWFKISPGLQFHIIEGAKKTIELPEFSHICFSIKNVSDFTKTLTQNKITFSDSMGKKGIIQHRADGVNQIFFQDPDGYWIEVNDNAVHNY